MLCKHTFDYAFLYIFSTVAAFLKLFPIPLESLYHNSKYYLFMSSAGGGVTQ